MPTICNISINDIRSGKHPDADVLIQISDYLFPTPKKEFLCIHQFEFSDIEFDGLHPELQITEDQILEIISLLKKYKEMNKNILIHCHAGFSRSGAIVEIAVRYFGYTAVHDNRIPNKLIVSKFQEILEKTYE